MPSSLAIGDFSRATHLSVKTLRHYHRVGLLAPVEIDPQTGYRRYATEQIPTAQVIRRFRDLDMPLEQIHTVLCAPDIQTRNELITAHLSRLEEGLARTQSAVASLRDLLEDPSPSTPIELRKIEATPAAAVCETIDLRDASPWYEGALGELHAALAAQGLPVDGPPGGVFDDELFSRERGRVTIFLPCQETVRAVGRVESLRVPAAELAIVVHVGSHDDIDRAYGSLATYVAQHALAVDGQLREHYLVGRHDTDDESRWRTEIGWPIFQTSPG